MGQVSILVGAQWGDEGKGKWIDILSKDAQVIARYQGGNNAGHTLYVDGEKIVLHQIPSGIFQGQTQLAITAGVVVNPPEFVKELAKVQNRVKLTPERLWLSARAHVITPWHMHIDGWREQNTTKPIGTTKKGIGPTYADKTNRIGLRLGEYIQPAMLNEWLEQMRRTMTGFAEWEVAHAEAWQEFAAAAATLKPFVCDAEQRLRDAIDAKQKIILEGAQGALLDINHGTYPYVTSSSTSAGGAIAGIGFAPRQVEKIYGVAKAYVTRVGEGPMPTELKDATGQHIATKGREFGATTGRPRRCGWLDAVALRYAVQVNGIDALILNKLDILTGLDEIKIATAYEHPRLGRIHDYPWDTTVLAACSPVYVSCPGWKQELPMGQPDAKLPGEVLNYIDAIEEFVRCPITMIGTGVNREDAVFLT